MGCNNSDDEIMLEVRDLRITFPGVNRRSAVVNGISYTVKKGEIMGLVGESGSGKSVHAYGISGVLSPPGCIENGAAVLDGRDILSLTPKEREAFRGTEISMIFQNPMSSLDPVFTIGNQMIETIRAHNPHAIKAAARAEAIEMLREVSIRNPERIMKQYPFELSGGMCQRVMIAMSLTAKPKLLFADEPTTALDVTTQAQILRLLKRLQADRGMSIVYITHDLGIVAELCDSVSVMCSGTIVEQGSADDIYYHAAHPYTQMLLKALPRMDTVGPLASIKPEPAVDSECIEGCVFYTRCDKCDDRCKKNAPPRVEVYSGHSARCWQLREP